MSRHCGKQYYAARGKLLEWVACIRAGDWFTDDYKAQFRIVANDLETRRIYIELVTTNPLVDGPYTPSTSAWSYDNFTKMSMDRGVVRLCNNCKRPRGEHLKRKKCLFGAGEWR